MRINPFNLNQQNTVNFLGKSVSPASRFVPNPVHQADRFELLNKPAEQSTPKPPQNLFAAIPSIFFGGTTTGTGTRRFRQIIKGKVRERLKKYVNPGQMIGKQGKKLIAIPTPTVDMPRFSPGKSSQGGVGEGEGEDGTPIGRTDGDESGAGQAGGDPAEHINESLEWITMSEYAKIIAEKLQLPNLELKGNKNLKTYTYDLPRIANRGLHLDKQRTIKAAVRRKLTETGKLEKRYTEEENRFQFRQYLEHVIALKNGTEVPEEWRVDDDPKPSEDLMRDRETVFKPTGLGNAQVETPQREEFRKYVYSQYNTTLSTMPSESTDRDFTDKLTINLKPLIHRLRQRHTIVPQAEDIKKIVRNIIEKPQANVAIIYAMDASGSMTDDMKEWARHIAFNTDAVISWMTGEENAKLQGQKFSHEKHYGEGVVRRFIIHDAVGKEVSEYDFYHTRESGGTRMSSAYVVADQILDELGPDWNVYLYHIGDGDNWGEDDSKAFGLLDEKILPRVNSFGYIQTDSPYGSGEYINKLRAKYGEGNNKVRSIEIDGIDEQQMDAVMRTLFDKREKK